MVEKECLYCGKTFMAKPSYLKRGHAKYCSRICSCKSNAKNRIPAPKTEIKCDFCGKSFCTTIKSAIRRASQNKTEYRFCSKACKTSAQKLGTGFENMLPDHYGLGNGAYNYRDTALANKPNICNRCGYSQVVQILEVHHIDRNRENNDLSNLEILCPNCHQIEHYNAKDGRYTGRQGH